MRLLLVAVFAVSLIGSTIVAQESGAPPGIYKPGSEIMEELDRAAASSASAGGWSVAISPGVSVRRRSSSVAQYAIIHPWSVEIYRILEGSGTFVTGGLLELPLAASTDPNIVRTEHGIKGGLARQVSAGDILVLQPGTPHWFSTINGETITYMESRIQITTHPVQYQ
ncbi:MAG: cupin domain-containing protein [Pseudohongiella sp.]|jgi:mannose-6-phosphate isomerase-like protein (cupin superfamily)|nr:cupin domain-containing protein [Pseudohongiella sp.]